MYKILIAENIPSLNKGELTLLSGFIESFKVLGDFHVKILSSMPETDQKRYGKHIEVVDVRKPFHIPKNHLYSSKYLKIVISLVITFKHIYFLIFYKIFGDNVTKIMKSRVWKDYIDSDVIFIGHNGIFGIGNGLLGVKFQLLTFLSYLYIPFLGIILDKPLVIYGGSVPNLSNSKTRHWMSFLLSRIDLITVRENISYENLKYISYNNENTFLTADLAFLMTPASEKRINQIMEIENLYEYSKPLIGLTAVKHKAINSFKDMGPDVSYEKHLKIIVNVLDKLIEDMGATIVFIPHSIGLEQEFDDRLLANDIFKRCKHKENIKLITNEYSAEELKGIIGKLDLFIGERLHSFINAICMDVPSIVMSNKNDQRLEIIRELSQEDLIFYLDDMDEEKLLAKIESVLSKKSQIKRELNSQIKIAQKKSFTNGVLLKRLLDKQKNI